MTWKNEGPVVFDWDNEIRAIAVNEAYARDIAEALEIWEDDDESPKFDSHESLMRRNHTQIVIKGHGGTINVVLTDEELAAAASLLKHSKLADVEDLGDQIDGLLS